MRPELKRAVERALCASPRILNARYILTFPGDWRCSFAETWAGVAAFSSHTDPSAVRANARTLPWTGDNLHKRTCEGESWYTNVRWYESPNMCVSKCGSKLTVVCEQLNRKKKVFTYVIIIITEIIITKSLIQPTKGEIHNVSHWTLAPLGVVRRGRAGTALC